MQAAVAPFVLENLGCSGAEARLVDCPVEAGTLARDYSFDYFGDYSNFDTCDPFSAGGGTFARIACGTSSSVGVLYSHRHAWRDLLGLLCSNHHRMFHIWLTRANSIAAGSAV